MSQPPPTQRIGAGMVVLIVLAAVVMLGVIGTGTVIAYRYLMGPDAPETPPAMVDIAGTPEVLWTMDFTDGSGESPAFSLHTVGPDLGLVVLEHNPKGLGYAERMEVALVDLARGEELWRDTEVIPPESGHGTSWRVVSSDTSDQVGLLLHGFDAGDYSQLLLFNKKDGARVAEHRHQGYLNAALYGPHVVLATQDEQDRGPTTLQQFADADLESAPMWVLPLAGAQSELCVVDGMVVAATYAFEFSGGCGTLEEAVAFDGGSAEPVGWTAGTDAYTYAHVSTAGVLNMDMEFPDGRRSVTLAGLDGEELWEQPFAFQMSRYASAEISFVSDSEVLLSTEAGLESLDIATGQRRWRNPVEQQFFYGLVGDSVVGSSGQKIVWADRATGEPTHSLVPDFDPGLYFSPGSSEDHLYLISHSEVVALDAMGAESWRYTADGDAYVEAAGGRLVLMDHFGARLSGLG